MKTRDAQATRDRILKAAFKEFTDRGFAGARVDSIAERAKVNKALLYQHYGDKEELFKQVLHCKMHELLKVRIDPDRFADCAGEFFDLHAANPWMARLLQWEALDFGCRPVPNEAERREHLAGHVAEIEAGQASGRFDRALDPKQTLLTLMSVVVFWFTAPQTARLVTGENPYTPDALAKRRAHVIQIARKIVEVR